MSEKRVLGWQDAITKARSVVQKSDSDISKIPDEVVMAFLQKETGGRVNAAIGSREFAFGEPVIKKSGVYRSIMGGFQMRVDRFCRAMSGSSSLKYLSSPSKNQKGKVSLGKDNCILYTKEIFDNREIQVEAWMRDMLLNKNIHGFKADLMGLCWFNPSSLEKYKNLLPQNEKDKLNRFERITPGSDEDAIKFLESEQIPENNSTLSYPTGIYRNTKRFAELTGNNINEDVLFIKDWSNSARGESTLGGSGASTLSGSSKESFSAILGNKPFEIGSYLTPEEMRSGINAKYINITDWYLLQMGDAENEQLSDEKKSLSENDSLIAQFAGGVEGVATKLKNAINAGSSYRGDTSLNPRQLYIQAIVEAEFLKERYGIRSIPAVAGPFNPYVLAGFPGLIMTPTRPMLAFVESVSHSINVGGGNGSTVSSFGYPRYHDEGEVFYFMGGEYSTDPLYRRFPQWHNSLTVPVNHASNLETLYQGGRGTEQLDTYYQFLIGCDSIDYISSHAGVPWTKTDYENAIQERIPGPFKINPETLEIKEYNSAIAELDSEGRFAPGTLAHEVYGNVEPDRNNKMVMTVDEQMEYVERYGVREEELLTVVLENSYDRYKNRLILYGQTFDGTVDPDGKKGPNYFQKKIVDWMEDLERRDLKGGVK